MKLIRVRLHAAIFTSTLLVIGLNPGLNASDTQSVTIICADQAKQLLGQPDTVIIDVRKPRNWWRTSQKILSAVREDPSKIDQWAQKYAKNQTFIFY
jgi:hypothetical protein